MSAPPAGSAVGVGVGAFFRCARCLRAKAGAAMKGLPCGLTARWRPAGAKAPRASSRASALKFIVICTPAWSERPAIRRATADSSRGSAAAETAIAPEMSALKFVPELIPALILELALEPSTEGAAKLASKLAAAHGRTTTRAAHPVVSRTISRTAVADRLRMGFDKRRPPPLALVAALAQSGWSFSIGPFLSRSVRLPARRNPSVPPTLSPLNLTCEAARALGSERKILPRFV